ARNLQSYETLRLDAVPLLRVLAQLREGALDRAAAALLASGAFTAADLAGPHRDALIRLGALQLRAAQPAKALAAFSRGRVRLPADAELCFGQGPSELDFGKLDAAVATLREA